MGNTIVIKNGRIVDGTGEPGFIGDIAIEDGKITAIGTHLDDGDITLDATDRVVTPGFIDPHTHYDAQITWDPYLNPSPALGVTTCIIGNCGFTIAPNRPEHRDLFMRNLTQVEGMSLEALRTGIDWSFRSFPE